VRIRDKDSAGSAALCRYWSGRISTGAKRRVTAGLLWFGRHLVDQPPQKKIKDIFARRAMIYESNNDVSVAVLIQPLKLTVTSRGTAGWKN
jgi:hypothetical protein